MGALFRETRAAAGLPPATEFPIIRECHVGSGTGKAGRGARALVLQVRGLCQLGRRLGLRAQATASAPISTSSPQNRFIIGSQDEVVEQIGRYGERTGTDHILVRVQWPGLDQKTAVHTFERLGRVVEQLG